MATNKLTDRHLRNIKPTDKEQLLGDGGGLWVRVLPQDKGGAINFYYRFRLAGRERRYNCGTYPQTSLAEAREQRNRAMALVRTGIDPVEKEVSDRTQAMADQAAAKMEKTVDGLFDDWQRVYLSVHHQDGGQFVQTLYNRDIKPLLGQMKARDVRLPHIVQVIDKMLDRGVRRKANMALSNLRQMFRHGIGRAIVDTDPTLGLNKKQAGGKETPVDRNLSLDEIRELSTALSASGMPPRMQAATWLVLATGARVREMLHAEWNEFDLQEKIWTIPAKRSKNGRQHLVHLSTFALRQLEILADYRSGPYLFAGRIDGQPISDKALTKAVRDRIRSEPLKKRSPNTGSLLLSGGPWTPHDLRRTLASRMGDLGIAPHVIERCLNHTQQGIVGVYQRQEYMPDRKLAFATWGRQLEDCTSQ